jgi:hypothetical protein
LATVEDTHSHFLTKTNIQMCKDCRRFFIITYEKNERGEAVETGHEIDIRITSSGIVHPKPGDWDPAQSTEAYRRKKEDDRRELSCF